MLDGKFEALPVSICSLHIQVLSRTNINFQRNAWQPFGYGLRACIGRAFAWQEAILVMASIVQKFDLELVDPNYELELQQSLTIKPKNLRIRAKLREIA
jgi:cytochrome P450 / NADPH-cytochrome P450 reductase